MLYTVYQVDALTRSQAYCLLTAAAHLLLLLLLGAPALPLPDDKLNLVQSRNPAAAAAFHLDPAEFLRAGRSIHATHARPSSSRCVKQQHHTTPNQYEERGRGGRRRSR